MAKDGFAARAPDERTLAELMDPAALEKRLREARARRAAAIALRDAPATPPAAESTRHDAPAPPPAPPSRPLVPPEPPLTAPAAADGAPLRAIPPTPRLDLRAEPATAETRRSRRRPAAVFMAGLGLGGAAVAATAFVLLPDRIDTAPPPQPPNVVASAVEPAAAPPRVAGEQPAAQTTPAASAPLADLAAPAIDSAPVVFVSVTPQPTPPPADVARVDPALPVTPLGATPTAAALAAPSPAAPLLVATRPTPPPADIARADPAPPAPPAAASPAAAPAPTPSPEASVPVPTQPTPPSAEVARADPAPPATPAAASLPAQVAIHYPASAEAVAQSTRAALQDAGVPRVEIIPVRFSISRSNIRYYHDADREAAGSVATLIAPDLPDSQTPPARDFTDYATPAAPGNIELWLAGTSATTSAAPAPAAPPPAPAPPAAATDPDSQLQAVENLLIKRNGGIPATAMPAPDPDLAQAVERILIQRLTSP